MKEYTVIFKAKPSIVVWAPGKKALINEHFGGSADRFNDEVQKLVWDELSMQCVYDVKTDKVSSQLFTADINPYGWRNA